MVFKRIVDARIRIPDSLEGRMELRRFLHRDFLGLCGYCLRSEKIAGGIEGFEVDHFRPRSKFRMHRRFELYGNLYWTCGRCNRKKSDLWPNKNEMNAGMRWLDPCVEAWYDGQHLWWLADGTLSVRSPAGEYTKRGLALDLRPNLVEFRRVFQLRLIQYLTDQNEIRQVEQMLAVGMQFNDYLEGKLAQWLIQKHADVSRMARDAREDYGALWEEALAVANPVR